MLDNILLHNPSNICVIIQDDDAIKGTDVFRALVKHDIENDTVREIHLIACENPPEYYLNGLDCGKIVVHNMFEDPICWLQKSDCNLNTIFNRMLTPKNVTSMVMIDSLNFLINLEDVNYTFRKIHKMKKLFSKVTCLLHINQITCNETVKKFMFLSHVYLKLQQCKPNSSKQTINVGTSKLAEVIYVKPSGKITNCKEIIHVDESFHLRFEPYSDVVQNSLPSNLKDSYKNITTFRLGLDIKENERNARDNLILPYVRTAKNTKSGEGEIIYYADSDDDLEEDPDDDLDI